MLILRDECQPLLDANGLENLHVSMDGNKSLCLSTECGKKLVTISSIRFAKTVISERERKIAVDLFEKFIKKHIQLLKEYINFRKSNSHIVEDIENEKPQFHKFLGSYNVGNGIMMLYANRNGKENDISNISFLSNGSIAFSAGSFTIEWIEENKKEILQIQKQAMKFFELNKIYNEYINKETELIKKISTCSI